ncbi:fructosamine kinase family protein [Corynebacterium sp. ES2794-CONJ1]|uniref:fructosamine kinase family protein n=1 Tax=unclassified Corynebacterium TaxID=2624378 RepID=UPI002167E9BF|nr:MULTISPECIES: fructosamine kinase family protein [unclassified Corynebacterium]MCS4490635.1 fructosamine kinase family protein [Corynebacterium sp. ES2775-CONJ]MCS4532600.1 fructosamine kinase family protein [Corynebacterium sp. ES2730-CONJ]MCU9519995.1 fructosamine kinase family protein [Corynebacterium sp. ES2794-CONJ1]
MSGFKKTVAPHLAGAPQCEAKGLIWLREGSSAVVEVLEVDNISITTEYIEHTSPSALMAWRAGQELARIHALGAPAFGAPPPGWEGDIYIGTQRQSAQPTADWAEFYCRQRVWPFVIQAVASGNLSTRDEAVLATVLEKVEQIQWPTIAPARIHGDLWNGNLIFGTHGPFLIDPAAHGGHPLTDLAMLELFGCPYLEEFFAGYQKITALPENFRSMLSLHQLHPLAVHTFTHGPSYAPELMRAAYTTLKVLA